jgi:hypothetical protein
LSALCIESLLALLRDGHIRPMLDICMGALLLLSQALRLFPCRVSLSRLSRKRFLGLL